MLYLPLDPSADAKASNKFNFHDGSIAAEYITALCLVHFTVPPAVTTAPAGGTDSFCDGSRPYLYTVRVQWPRGFANTVTNSVTASSTCTCYSNDAGECKLYPNSPGAAETSANPKCVTGAPSGLTQVGKDTCASAGIKCYDVQVIAQVSSTMQLS